VREVNSKLTLSLALTVVFTLFATAAFGADLFSGTWKVNMSKSEYNPGPPPQSGITKIEATDNGFKLIADGVNSDGSKTHTEFTVKFDDSDYPNKSILDGKSDPNGADMISANKIDDYSMETTAKLNGKVLMVTKSVVSKDGKTLTATFNGATSYGTAIINTIVYDKQ
jgi:hypothetical protein